jgi:hypothetical protein
MGLGIPGIASALNLDRALERLVSGEPDAPLLAAVRSDHERLA